MADNTTTQTTTLATIPGSTTIATDDVGGAHFQKIKLADGTADSSAMIPGDATNGLDVDVTRLPALPAGTNNIGDVDVLSLPNEGQQSMANSISVAIASDQSAVPVSGTVSVGGTVDTELPTAAALADNTANPTVPAVGAFLMGFDGTNWDRLQTGAATGGALKVDGSAVTQPISGTVSVTEPVSVDDNGAALTVDNGGTFAVQESGSALTALQLIDDIVFTDDAAFTAATSKVAAVGGIVTADSVDSGDVGAFAMLANRQQKVTLYDSAGVELAVGGGTQYTEDAAAAANPIGNAINLIRQDTPAGLVTTDGDNVAMRGTNFGAGFVQVLTSAGAFVDSFGGGTEYAQGTATTDTDVLKMAGAVRRDTAAVATGVADGDRLVLSTDSVGRLRVTSADLALPAGTNNIGDVDVLTVPAPLSTTGGGTEATALRVTVANDSTGVLSVDDNGGALTVDQATAANLNAQVQGPAAHDDAITGNPVRIGARAETSLETITLVADGDTTDLHADVDGVLVTKLYTTFAELISERVSNTNGNSTAFSTFGAGGTSIRNYITAITVFNEHATTNGYVDIRDGTAGSIIWTIPAPATGGAVVHFNPPLRQPTANTALAYDTSAAITTIFISVNGFQAK